MTQKIFNSALSAPLLVQDEPEQASEQWTAPSQAQPQVGLADFNCLAL